MRIQALSISTIKPSAIQKFSNNDTQNNQPSSFKRNNIDKLSNYYYPIVFQGEPQSHETQILEKKLDEFCQNNMGETLEYIHPKFWDIELTKSRFINKEFNDAIKSVLHEAQQQKSISEETLIGYTREALTFSYSRIHKNLPHEEQTAMAREDALKIINEYKKQKEITEPLKIEEDSTEYNEIRDFILDSFEEKYSALPASHKKFLIGSNIRLFHDYINKHDKPVFDEKVSKKIKSILDNEPFVSFNTKTLKAESQIAKAIPVEECAETIYKDSISKKISPFENPKLYQYATSTYENLDLLFENLYGYGYPEIEGYFKEIGIDPKHKVLLIDPAIANSLPELKDFIEQNHINTEDLEPIELRQKFSDFLGTETIYRGLYSDTPEILIDKLKEEGNFAGVYKNREEALDAIKYYISNNKGVRTTIRGRISDKIKKPNENHEFLSASSIYDIAASVPKKIGRPDSPVVVIKAEVPKLSLIKQKNVFNGMQYNSYHKTLYVGYKRFPYDSNQEEIEIFVPFYLPTDNAEFIIDTKTPNFSWE